VRRNIFLLVGLTLCLGTGPSALVPESFSNTQVVDGLQNPTAMAFAPDGRLFVCLQGGDVRVIKDGTLLPSPFTTVNVDSAGERGLLGIAFDPNFTTNGYLYVYYTATSPTTHNRVSRFTANGDTAVPGSEVVIAELDTLSAASNHNGGALHFGPDRKLYVAVGDNANGANAQTLGNRFGKVLRLNADGSIPTDNPFYLSAQASNRAIWTLGLRNPFTFAFHPDSGRMLINDVGEVSFEEVNEGVVAANYGWPESEGSTANPNHKSPLYAYGHGSGAFTGCAITGGAFYVPAAGQFPDEYVGKYFFADYCGGWINTLDVTGDSGVRTFASGLAFPVDLKVGPDGSLYYLARGTGSVGKISYTPNEAPAITSHPADQSVSAGEFATFSVEAVGAGPLSYQWQRNGSNIAGATSKTYAVKVTATDDGALFRVRVTNLFGSATSSDALLTVSGNSLPVAAITSPAPDTLYTAGSVISYAGAASDPEDGLLPSGALTWQIDFHHDDHKHPFMPPTTGGATGTFMIPQTGETSANVWYRIVLTAVDSDGAMTTTFRDVHPRTASITVDSVPGGLPLTLDGQPVQAPHTFTGVVGLLRTIGAPSTQVVDGVSYLFRSWSDGGADTHQVATPSGAITYTARYDVPPPPPSGPVYLSDLEWTSATNGWGPAERDMSNGETAAGDGTVITLGGTAYAKGLGVHAGSDVRYAIPPGCSQFQATVGVDDEVGPNGSMTFAVWADGVLLFESSPLVGGAPGQDVVADIGGRRELRLIAGDAGDGIYFDHGDWAAARFTCAPLYLSDLEWTSATNGWGPVERDKSNGERAAGDGTVITLGGTTYAKGLGVHAGSELKYAIPAGCTQFQARVGVDDEVGNKGSMTFAVWADEELLFEGSPLLGGAPGQDIAVDIGGRRELRLVAGDAGDGIYLDHGDWAAARLMCVPIPPSP